MKFFSTLVLATTVLALPTEDKRQLGTVGSTANEFKTGGCKDIIFVWARGSTEIGNMVSSRYFAATWLHISDLVFLIIGHCRWPPGGQPPQERVQRPSCRSGRRLRCRALHQLPSRWCRPRWHQGDGDHPWKHRHQVPQRHCCDRRLLVRTTALSSKHTRSNSSCEIAKEPPSTTAPLKAFPRPRRTRSPASSPSATPSSAPTTARSPTSPRTRSRSSAPRTPATPFATATSAPPSWLLTSRTAPTPGRAPTSSSPRSRRSRVLKRLFVHLRGRCLRPLSLSDLMFGWALWRLCLC